MLRISYQNCRKFATVTMTFLEASLEGVGGLGGAKKQRKLTFVRKVRLMAAFSTNMHRESDESRVPQARRSRSLDADDSLCYLDFVLLLIP